MINVKQAEKYCKDNITKIENYEIAKNDEQIWDCHHRLELTLNNEKAISQNDLKRFNMYFDRPYFELIFLSHKEHTKLHRSVQKISEETKRKISETLKGFKQSAETIEKRKETLKKIVHVNNPTTYFGIEYKKHTGLTRQDDIKRYNRERDFYRYHKRLSWK